MNATTKQQLALAKIRNFYYHFNDDIDAPFAIVQLIGGQEKFRDEATSVVDTWLGRCLRKFFEPNDPRMDFAFALAYYVKMDYDRSIFRMCVCDAMHNHGWKTRDIAKAASELYRSRLAEAESLVGELVIDPPAVSTEAGCGCNVCMARVVS